VCRIWRAVGAVKMDFAAIYATIFHHLRRHFLAIFSRRFEREMPSSVVAK
jgi:hypothetical protein